MIWHETRPLILTTGYVDKKMPPEDGKELSIFPLLLFLSRNIQRVGSDDERRNDRLGSLFF